MAEVACSVLSVKDNFYMKLFQWLSSGCGIMDGFNVVSYILYIFTTHGYLLKNIYKIIRSYRKARENVLK